MGEEGGEWEEGGWRGETRREREKHSFPLVHHVTLVHAGNWDCRSKAEGTVEVISCNTHTHTHTHTHKYVHTSYVLQPNNKKIFCLLLTHTNQNLAFFFVCENIWLA